MRLRTRGASVLFEGAQGTMLDIDHGTFPFVTSSNTVAGYASVGTGLGPRDIDDVLGIVKAYTTRVGAGPFPTELDDEVGSHLSRVGPGVRRRHRPPAAHAAGSTRSRSRRSIVNNGITGLCVTKLDVLDGLDEVKYCTAYGEDGRPRYETMPGWKERTAGLRALDRTSGGGPRLSRAARVGLRRAGHDDLDRGGAGRHDRLPASVRLRMPRPSGDP